MDTPYCKILFGQQLEHHHIRERLAAHAANVQQRKLARIALEQSRYDAPFSYLHSVLSRILNALSTALTPTLELFTHSLPPSIALPLVIFMLIATLRTASQVKQHLYSLIAYAHTPARFTLLLAVIVPLSHVTSYLYTQLEPTVTAYYTSLCTYVDTLP